LPFVPSIRDLWTSFLPEDPSFLELGELDRKIITVQCHAPSSAIQSENQVGNQGLKAQLSPQPDHDTDESLKIFHRDQDGRRKPIA